MSINHINTNELDANFKSLKINNSVVSLPVKDNYYYTGSFGSQAVRYLEPWSGNGTTGGTLVNQLAPLRNIKITNILGRKQNASPATDFILSTADLDLNNPIDVYTISLTSGQFYKNETVNITINSDRTLFVRTQSTGSGNPQDVQVTIIYEQI
jgi:hypothetical protein